MAEIRRLNVIAVRAGDVLTQLDAAPAVRKNLPSTLQMILTGTAEGVRDGAGAKGRKVMAAATLGVGAFDGILTELEAATEPPLPGVIVGIDECINHRSLDRFLRPLVSDGTVKYSGPFWKELRARSSGQVFLASGGVADGIHSSVDWGRRLEGDSWPDQRLVALSVGYLISYRTVVFLTADRAGDQHGLRPLLYRAVKPTIDRCVAQRNSLVILLKRPQTTIERYAKGVGVIIGRGAYAPGFSEVKV